MKIVGVDLSGPSNIMNTCLVYFQEKEDQLLYTGSLDGATDQQVYELVAGLARESSIIVGLDAPLSYSPGGGDRPADAALRRKIIAAGMHSGSVMAPTTFRMVYLTLRGISIARGLVSLDHQPIHLVEVHPGAALALRGAPIAAVRQFKTDPEARLPLLNWLEAQNVAGVLEQKAPTSHYVAACAAALAAWKWYRQKSAWVMPAQPPYHPYDFAC